MPCPLKRACASLSVSSRFYPRVWLSNLARSQVDPGSSSSWQGWSFLADLWWPAHWGKSDFLALFTLLWIPFFYVPHQHKETDENPGLDMLIGCSRSRVSRPQAARTLHEYKYNYSCVSRLYLVIYAQGIDARARDATRCF